MAAPPTSIELPLRIRLVANDVPVVTRLVEAIRAEGHRPETGDCRLCSALAEIEDLTVLVDDARPVPGG